MALITRSLNTRVVGSKTIVYIYFNNYVNVKQL